MDRRDALKKLGMGGATVVGASMLMTSSPAFATTTAGGVTASAVADSKSQVTVTITQAPAGCTASATGRTVSWTYRVNGPQIVDTGNVPGTPVTATPVSATVIRPKNATGNFTDGTTITVSATSTYTCVGSGNAPLQVTTSSTFTYSGQASGSWSPAGTVALA